MSNIFKSTVKSLARGDRYASAKYTGITHRSNQATGDVGPDAEQDMFPPRNRPAGPRGRNRKMGGDVRSPLS